MADILIIGGGPAGVSAALYAVRAGAQTALIYRDGGALSKAHSIANFYGFPEGVSGAELQRRGLTQAEALGVRVLRDEVQAIDLDERFRISASQGEHFALSVVLATGAPRKAPGLPGVRELEGRGVSYCATCDGAFWRGRQVAVLGGGDFAAREAAELQHIAGSVVLLTGGEGAPANLPAGIEVDARPVTAILGEGKVEGVAFQGGAHRALDAVFIALGVAGAADFARRTGIMTDGDHILTEMEMDTNVPGLFAAGDCAGAPYQVAKAVEDGRRAGMAAVKYARALKKG